MSAVASTGIAPPAAAVTARGGLRIQLCSVPFAPSIGGIETVSGILAEEFVRAGHEVTVVTRTPADGPNDRPFRVLRRPGWRQLYAATRAADVVLHNNVSLRLGLALPACPRPWVVAHHVWTPRRGPGSVAGRVKHASFRLARNLAVSRAVARSLAVSCRIVPNPYDESTFMRLGGVAPEAELVFLGRLVSDKGVVVLIDALAELARRGRRPRLTVIGDGPEEARLRAAVEAHGLGPQVCLAGTLRGPELVARLNAHRVLVVPSTWEEPFGIVALEGLACGLLPVVAASGGLPDAIGDCGLVVPKGDAPALAAALTTALDDPGRVASLRAGANAHLARHTRAAVARAYLDELEAACGARAR